MTTRAARRRQPAPDVDTTPSGRILPNGPEIIEIPPVGVELYLQAQAVAQQAQAAAQRLQDFLAGILAGQGYTANYTIQATPTGPRLIRQDPEEGSHPPL